MAKNWVSKAFSKNKGSLTKTAKQTGGFNKKTGKIKSSWLNEKAKSKGKIGKRARLAKTARGFKH